MGIRAEIIETGLQGISLAAYPNADNKKLTNHTRKDIAINASINKIINDL